MNALRAWGSIAGGSLAIAGALLPWLTLDAGLHRYGGTTGLYGWLVLAAGAVAVAAGARELFAPPQWLVRANGLLGIALAVFACWLLAGVDQLVRRPDNAMLVPQAGPGLYLVIAGAIVIVFSAVSVRPKGAAVDT
jgi:hypothetical protein